MLGKDFSRRHTEIFLPWVTICMKCQILFSEKKKKDIVNLSPAELSQRVVKVNISNPIIKQSLCNFNSLSQGQQQMILTFLACVQRRL